MRADSDCERLFAESVLIRGFAADYDWQVHEYALAPSLPTLLQG
jgi:hypothetical protein